MSFCCGVSAGPFEGQQAEGHGGIKVRPWPSMPICSVNRGTEYTFLFQINSKMEFFRYFVPPMNVSTLPSRQQARTEDTRHAILDAAVALYEAQGVEGTTTSAVIDRSGLGRTTFYRYFRDADEVLNQAVIRDFDAVMADFAAQRHEHPSLAAQIVEDMLWFIRQLRRRPALKLLFADNSAQLYERLNVALTACTRATLACIRPTFERAQRQGRLRPGVTLEKYVEWCSFVGMSLQIVDFFVASDEAQLRAMLQDFLVPSLIVPNDEKAPADAPQTAASPVHWKRPEAAD